MRHEGFALTLSQGDPFPNSLMSRPPAVHAFPRQRGMAPADNSSLLGAAVALRECAAPMRAVQESLPRKPP
jgi:hypothetical protein